MYQREHGARTRTRHARGRTRDHTRNRIPNRMYEIRYVPGAASTPRTSFPVPSATAAPLFNTLVAKLGRLTRRSACPKGHPRAYDGGARTPRFVCSRMPTPRSTPPPLAVTCAYLRTSHRLPFGADAANAHRLECTIIIQGRLSGSVAFAPVLSMAVLHLVRHLLSLGVTGRPATTADLAIAMLTLRGAGLVMMDFHFLGMFAYR